MNDIHAAILTMGHELFPDQSEASYESLLAGLVTREQAFKRLHDLTTLWKKQQSPESDVATVATTDNHPAAELQQGMYRNPTTGQIFKVQPSQQGRLYAKELVTGHFEYARGAIFSISPAWRMTTEEISAYGVETGSCLICQRELTVPESVRRGIGPICYAKYC